MHPVTEYLRSTSVKVKGQYHHCRVASWLHMVVLRSYSAGGTFKIVIWLCTQYQSQTRKQASQTINVVIITNPIINIMSSICNFLKSTLTGENHYFSSHPIYMDKGFTDDIHPNWIKHSMCITFYWSLAGIPFESRVLLRHKEEDKKTGPDWALHHNAVHRGIILSTKQQSHTDKNTPCARYYGGTPLLYSKLQISILYLAVIKV